ncbi:asparagine synthetase B, partial [Verrucomicrobia bacterium]|nr:asparagine synthetase B [Verrucomicrobiota bacterium]
MCGFVGFTDPKLIEHPNTLLQCIEELQHRGPDDKGVWLSNNKTVGFAHSRLAVVDLSSDGRQPMRLSDFDLTIVFNG